MAAIEMIRSLFEETYPLFNGVVDDLTLAELKQTTPGSTVGSIMFVFAHTAIAEDGIVQELGRSGTELFTRGGWDVKLGIRADKGFFREEDLASLDEDGWKTLRAYAEAVQAETTAFIATLTDADLAREMEIWGSPRTLGYLMANYAYFHLLEHTGEMAALKGTMGKKGMPY